MHVGTKRISSPSFFTPSVKGKVVGQCPIPGSRDLCSIEDCPPDRHRPPKRKGRARVGEEGQSAGVPRAAQHRAQRRARWVIPTKAGGCPYPLQLQRRNQTANEPRIGANVGIKEYEELSVRFDLRDTVQLIGELLRPSIVDTCDRHRTGRYSCGRRLNVLRAAWRSLDTPDRPLWQRRTLAAMRDSLGKEKP